MRNKRLLILVIIVLVLSNLIIGFKFYKIEENKKYLISVGSRSIHAYSSHARLKFELEEDRIIIKPYSEEVLIKIIYIESEINNLIRYNSEDIKTYPQFMSISFSELFRKINTKEDDNKEIVLLKGEDDYYRALGLIEAFDILTKDLEANKLNENKEPVYNSF